jgi:hypothetical protein
VSRTRRIVRHAAAVIRTPLRPKEAPGVLLGLSAAMFPVSGVLALYVGPFVLLGLLLPVSGPVLLDEDPRPELALPLSRRERAWAEALAGAVLGGGSLLAYAIASAAVLAVLGEGVSRWLLVLPAISVAASVAVLPLHAAFLFRRPLSHQLALGAAFAATWILGGWLAGAAGPLAAYAGLVAWTVFAPARGPGAAPWTWHWRGWLAPLERAGARLDPQARLAADGRRELGRGAVEGIAVALLFSGSVPLFLAMERHPASLSGALACLVVVAAVAGVLRPWNRTQGEGWATLPVPRIAVARSLVRNAAVLLGVPGALLGLLAACGLAPAGPAVALALLAPAVIGGAALSAWVAHPRVGLMTAMLVGTAAVLAPVLGEASAVLEVGFGVVGAGVAAVQLRSHLRPRERRPPVTLPGTPAPAEIRAAAGRARRVSEP